jgi:hypothetical protein
MVKALVIKEIKGVLGVAVLAFLTLLYVVASETGVRIPFALSGYQRSVPFVGGEFQAVFGTIAGLLAIALGLKQTVWEDLFGTWQFLLHRPMSRRTIIFWKLVVGAGVYLVCSAIPLLLYVWWAAAPGAHASPFLWEMTHSVWHMWVALLMIYLAAFLTGLRPARWYGTRLVPLAGAACGTAVVVMGFPWPILTFLVEFVIFVVLSVSIFHVARCRDFA